MKDRISGGTLNCGWTCLALATRALRISSRSSSPRSAHFDHQPAGQPRADALVEAFHVARRTVGRDDDLPAGIDQRIEGVGELRLGLLALQELEIVDHQHVDAAQDVLEGERGMGPQRR